MGLYSVGYGLYLQQLGISAWIEASKYFEGDNY